MKIDRASKILKWDTSGFLPVNISSGVLEPTIWWGHRFCTHMAALATLAHRNFRSLWSWSMAPIVYTIIQYTIHPGILKPKFFINKTKCKQFKNLLVHGQIFKICGPLQSLKAPKRKPSHYSHSHFLCNSLSVFPSQKPLIFIHK